MKKSYYIIILPSEFTARFPIVLLSLLPAGLLFYLSKKVKDIKFAFINTLVLFSFLEYIIITKMSILDSVLTSFATSACFCYFATFFADRKFKNIFWALCYLFTGLAVMAKGIPGIAIPAGVALVSSIIFKTKRETLKSFLWGVFILTLVILPWHILMLKTHNPLFFDEYIVKHHIQRFLGSDVIHRKQGFFFYFLTLLWGLFPHIFVLLSVWGKKISEFISKRDFHFELNIKNDYDKFVMLNIIAAIVVLVFFTSSGTKLITYILPIYSFMAVITGKIWYEYIENNENKNGIEKSVLLMHLVLVIACILFCFAGLILPENIRKLQIFVLIAFPVYVFISTRSLLYGKKLNALVSVCLFMSLISCFGIKFAQEFDYSYGQDDLMKFAQIAKEEGKSISTYETGKKYSLLYYSDVEKIDFHHEDSEWLKNELNKNDTILIMRNKDIEKLDVPVKIALKGVKYSVIQQ